MSRGLLICDVISFPRQNLQQLMTNSPGTTGGIEETKGSMTDQNPKLECVDSASPAPAENKSVDYGDWSCYRDDDIMRQEAAIQAQEAEKLPLVGDKEPLSALEDEYKSGNPIIREKIKLLSKQYCAIRRTRGDGNCFFRGFMFSYLEHILETQDKSEIVRVHSNINQCKKTLQSLGYADFTFEDFFSLFIEQLDFVEHGDENSNSHEELLQRSRDSSVSNYVVMFFRFVTSGEIRRRSDFYEPFVLGLSDTTIDQFCKISVEPMGAESDNVQIIALSDALGVAIRIVYLDGSSSNSNPLNVNHHDFVPSSSDDQETSTSDQHMETKSQHSSEPFVTLLYRPGHYDILYRS